MLSLSICLNFCQNQARYANKRYAYSKQNKKHVNVTFLSHHTLLVCVHSR